MGKDVLFASCTRGRKKDSELFRSVSRLKLRAEMLFFEANTEGLSTRYNSVLHRPDVQDRIVAFIHDDVRIDDAWVVEKLNQALINSPVVGVAGSSVFTTLTDPPTRPYVHWMQQPSSNWSGSVRHAQPGKTPVGATYGPAPRRCIVMDGLFLAVDPQRLNGARFDEQFAFHFYDLDFCLTAHHAGCVVSTWPIAVTHCRSGAEGYGSPEFLRAEQAFVAKWQEPFYRINSPQTGAARRSAAGAPSA